MTKLWGVMLIAAAALGQDRPAAPRAILTAKGLQEDAAILRKAYESLHPGLYRYNTKSEMDAAFASLAAQLNRGQSLQQAYLAFSLFAAKVKCGHTYPNFFNQPKSVVAELFLGKNRLPFYFQWMSGSMVVTRDFSPAGQFPRGTEISEIDSVPTAAILARLMTIARADGSNDAKRVALLEVSGDGLFETFDIYFPMFFPPSGPRFKLRARLPGASQARLVEAAPLSYEERIAPVKAREQSLKGGNEPAFQWSYLANGSALLRMPTWALYDSKWDWKAWLEARLDELVEKKAPALVVDLRGNEGGLDAGDPILSRLLRGDLSLAAAPRLVRYRKVPQDLAPFLDTWDPSFKDWGPAAKDLAAPWPTAPPVEYFRLTRFDDGPDGDVLRPSGKPYPGKVFVLVDSTNSSATFQFAQTVQRRKLGILVGQPTGGNQRGINGGAFFFLRLPNSKIELDLPLISTFPAPLPPDSGLTPDIVVQPAIADIAEGADPALAAVAKVMQQIGTSPTPWKP